VSTSPNPVATGLANSPRPREQSRSRHCVSEIEIHLSKTAALDAPRVSAPPAGPKTGHEFHLVQNKNNFKRENSHPKGLRKFCRCAAPRSDFGG